MVRNLAQYLICGFETWQTLVRRALVEKGKCTLLVLLGLIKFDHRPEEMILFRAQWLHRGGCTLGERWRVVVGIANAGCSWRQQG